jgi:hypothetical protein
MAYTNTKCFLPILLPFPNGVDNTQRSTILRGYMNDYNYTTGGATEYTPGGIGSTAFQVTAFSGVGLVTFSTMTGIPLVNGQTVVVYNTASNTNDGTYTVSNLVYTTATAGTFTAVPIPLKSLSGTAQTTQTAEGVGQIQFGQRAAVAQTLTLTAVTFSGGISTITYTTLVGPQLVPGQLIVVTGMSNAGNNGTFSVNAALPTSSSAGSFSITNPSGVATDSGTATGSPLVGTSEQAASLQVPTFADFSTLKGYNYVWDFTNQTIRMYYSAGSATVFPELGLGPTAVFDNTLTFAVFFPRSNY